MSLAKYSLDNTKIIYFFLAVLLIGGITSFGKLGKKEDAPFVIKSAVIMTRYPGAEPAEVERLITEPISREIQSMSGVYKIKSESMYGLSKITFELQPSLSASSIPQKWDELRRKVLNIQPQLPSGASAPTVSDDFGDVFGIYYGLTADDGYTYEEMRNWAERIKTQVVTADGVMKVALFGTQTEVVNIFISTNKLVGMGIDPKQLASLCLLYTSCQSVAIAEPDYQYRRNPCRRTTAPGDCQRYVYHRRRYPQPGDYHPSRTGETGRYRRHRKRVHGPSIQHHARER